MYYVNLEITKLLKHIQIPLNKNNLMLYFIKLQFTANIYNNLPEVFLLHLILGYIFYIYFKNLSK